MLKRPWRNNKQILDSGGSWPVASRDCKGAAENRVVVDARKNVGGGPNSTNTHAMINSGIRALGNNGHPERFVLVLAKLRLASWQQC